MIKKRLIAAQCTVIATCMVGIAHANSNNWTGPYVGIDAGVVFNDVQLTSQQLGFTSPTGTCNMSSDFSTLAAGIQVGYLYQFINSFVVGIEANPTVNTNQKHTLSCNSEFNPDVYDSFTFKNQRQSSIKGRVGRALNWNKSSLLPYLTAGASFAELGLTYENEGGDYYSNNITKLGGLVGVGVEWAFMQHWSIRAEYSYVDYGNSINLNIPSVYYLYDPNGKAQVDLTTSNILMAINYWF